MCLPVCPTYQLTLDEAESPRGRLSLLKAYYQDELVLDETLLTHLDHCLLCRSCEHICPAMVPFANIMDSARNDIRATQADKSIFKQVLLKLIRHKKRTKFFINSIKRSSLGRLAKLAPLKRNDSLKAYLQVEQLMQVAPRWKIQYPACSPARDRVGLFLGCVHEFIDNDSLKKTIKVLNLLGVDVVIPDRQECCGAMHLHSGEAHVADELYKKNIQSFAQHNITTIISLSSACTATLIERSQLQMEIGERGTVLHFTDLCSYLEDIHWYENRQLENINKTVLLHYPCTQKNVLKNTAKVSRLLKRIPGLSIREFNAISCCGAAGTYMLDYPQQSNRLKNLASSQIGDDIDILLTSNIACFMQFNSLQKPLKVMHPVQIVAQALSCQ